jgi:hypothetical protein
VDEYVFHNGAEASGPYHLAGIHVQLARYEQEHPDDPHFARVTIWEMQDKGMGSKLTAADFFSGPGPSFQPH